MSAIEASGMPVGILFSGGDSPGMNALLRAFVRLGLNRFQRPVLGIRDGYRGLVRTCRRMREGHVTAGGLAAGLPMFRAGGNDDDSGDLVRFDHRSVAGITARGGIVLGSSRCPEFKQAEVRRETIDLLQALGVQSLLVCGGEGSTKGAQLLAEEGGLRVAVVPGSIDNDVPCSDLTLGFDTAVNTVADCAQKFTDTACSHHRIMVLEIMGRDCGQLAVAAALASGAEIVVAPERGSLDSHKMHRLAERIETSMKHGRRHAIVLVTEHVPLADGSTGSPAKVLADSLEQFFHRPGSPFPQVDTRASVLGHVQRGGTPTAADRILAARFAEAAWDLFASSDSSAASGVLGVRGTQIVLHPFDQLSSFDKDSQIQRQYQLQKDLSRY